MVVFMAVSIRLYLPYFKYIAIAKDKMSIALDGSCHAHGTIERSA